MKELCYELLSGTQSVEVFSRCDVDSHPSMQYSTKYPSRPAAPMVSGGRHFTVTVVSVTSSTTSMVGSLVTAERNGMVIVNWLISNNGYEQD